jgi:integrase
MANAFSGDKIMNRPKEPHSKYYERQSKHGKRWQGIVIYYDSETGQRRQTAQTFATKRDAETWARKTEMQFRDNPHHKPPSDETVDEYLQRWLTIEDTLPLEEKTKRDYRQMAAHPIRELGTKPLKSLTLLDIQQFYAKLSEQKKSRRTVNYVHTVLKMALKDAVEWGLLVKNPADKAKAPLGRPEKPLRIPTPEEMHQLLEATRDTRWYPLWLWFATTGTRLGEALALRWGDIDWEKGQVTIRRALSGDAAHRVIKTPKSASGMRTFSLGPKIQATLRQLQEDQANWGEQAGSAWNDEDYVFTTYQGKLLSKRNIDRAFKQALEQAGLPSDIRIHDLRHGMATQWLSGGKSPKMVSERLGHSNVGFTLQVYGHVLPHDEVQAAYEMENQLVSGPEKSSTLHQHEV